MRTYIQLTQEQRYQISAMKKIGNSQKEIAADIGVHKGTISRELRRNTGERGYRPKQAHEKALGRRSKAQALALEKLTLAELDVLWDEIKHRPVVPREDAR